MNATITQNLPLGAAEKLREKIKNNGGYCLCTLVKDDRHICGPCKDFLEDGQTDNVCHCGLYHKRVEED